MTFPDAPLEPPVGREHEPSCPRFQFWDAGEWEAPCWCEPVEKEYEAEDDPKWEERKAT